MDKTAFLKATLGFISNHQWNSAAAKSSRSEQQQINTRNKYEMWFLCTKREVCKNGGME